MRAGSRVVVVVGASSGIGRATAHALAARGDRLVLVSRSAEALADVARECAARAPGTATAGEGEPAPAPLVVVADVTDGAAVDRAVAAAVTRHGRVDAVVHTAAVLAYGRFWDIPAEVFDRVVEVDVLGAANVARAALRRFEAQRSGHLVLVGSLLGSITAAWMSPYVVSKWAVHGLAGSLRAEARRIGARVSLVVPGGVDTPIYAMAGSFAGRVGRPPPPVDRPETVARAIVRLLDRPRREVSVGLANRAWTTVFRTVPAVYDRVVGPAMARLGLSRTPTSATPGNVFAPTPRAEGVHGRWGRHWLRGLAVGVAGVLGAVAVAGARQASRSQAVPARRRRTAPSGPASARAARAAFQPHAPWTPPPGWADALAR